MQTPLLIRTSRDADVPAITAIYSVAVRTGTASFELEPPDEAEIARRRAAVMGAGLPWLSAEHDGRVLGYAYAGPFRPRPAYRFAVENSIYVDQAAQGQGIGLLLLAELVARCESPITATIWRAPHDSQRATSSASSSKPMPWPCAAWST